MVGSAGGVWSPEHGIRLGDGMCGELPCKW